MYEHFFGLTSKPFALVPDPRFLYRSRHHALAMSMLEYGLESSAPLLLLTGEIGSGKTTLVRRLLDDLGNRVVSGVISNSHRRADSILGWVLDALQIEVRETSEIARYRALSTACNAHFRRGRRTLLVVDEAQNLQPDVLEELRLLSNINSERQLIFQIMLVGQPELRKTLISVAMRQIAQRIAAEYHLRPLPDDETGAYVRHRLHVAGATREIFSVGALAAVHEHSGGVPRLINQLCDYALVYAFSEQQPSVGVDTVQQVASDRASMGALPVFQGQPAQAAASGPVLT